MQIKNPEVYSLIESIGHHYRSNISNRFTRSILTMLPLENAVWNSIEELTEKSSNYRYQGYHLDELYTLILAMAKFVSAARKQNIQAFRHGGRHDLVSGQDRVMREMVVNNFASNVNVLADLINKLYVKAVELDKSQAGQKPPVYIKYPDSASLGRYLVAQ